MNDMNRYSHRCAVKPKQLTQRKFYGRQAVPVRYYLKSQQLMSHNLRIQAEGTGRLNTEAQHGTLLPHTGSLMPLWISLLPPGPAGD